MTWEAVGAIGEVAAAVAVVVSLVYLAIQVKGNSALLERTVQASRTQNSQSVVENFDRWRRMIIDSGSEDLWFRGVNNLDDLNPSETIRFNLIASSFIWSCWFTYQLQRNEGLMADVNEHLWQDLFKHPGYRKWLLEHRRFHSDNFGSFLDEVERSVGDDRYEPGEPSSLIDGSH